MPPPRESLERAALLIQRAHNVVALTGAGVSTASGVPDFRSVDGGLWHQQNPMEVATLTVFRTNPAAFFKWVRPLLRYVRGAAPNPAHEALAQLSASGKLHAVITQNIDGLHEAAGTPHVFALHGQVHTATCPHCLRKHPWHTRIDDLIDNGTIPRCDCAQSAVLKPDVILFGEQIPIKTLQAARRALLKADLLLILGTSLQVAPAGDMPWLAYEYGARLLIVNEEPTYADRYAEVVLRGDVSHILPELIRLVDTNDDRPTVNDRQKQAD